MTRQSSNIKEEQSIIDLYEKEGMSTYQIARSIERELKTLKLG